MTSTPVAGRDDDAAAWGSQMDAVVGDVHHELRNQLALVLGNADVLRLKLEGAPVARYADEVVSAAARCAGLVERFFQLLRAQPAGRCRVEVLRAVGEALELYEGPVRRHGVEVVYAVHEAAPDAYADPAILRRALAVAVGRTCEQLRRLPAPRRLCVTTRPEQEGRRIVIEIAQAGGDGPVATLDLPAAGADGGRDG
jgi:hypothetical protein